MYAPPASPATLLALDTGSATVSVALAREGTVLAERALEARHASERLLDLIKAVLREADLDRRQLDGILALRGPGSFTGLRIGLATALSLSEALELPGTGLPTLQVLASAVETAQGQSVLAAVDALRGEWFVQPFAGSEELAPAERLPLDRLPGLGVERAVGFGLAAACASHPSDAVRRLSAANPPPLAAAALRLAHREPAAVSWKAALLTAPLYLRAPNVRKPAGR